MNSQAPKGGRQPESREPRPARRRVFLIDDHPICRHGMAQLLNSEPDLVVCGEAENVERATPALRTTNAEIALLDLSVQGTAGLEQLREVHTHFPKVPVLAISIHPESLYALRALRAGAQGYIMKNEGLNQFLAAVRKVLSGEIYVNPAFGEKLIVELARGTDQSALSPIDRLSDRELEVLRLLGAGHATRDIATALGLSHKTVESHRLHIKEKLSLKNSIELVKFATDWVAQENVHSNR